MHPWLTDLQQLLVHGDPAVLVTVAHVVGSAPRDAGARMIVTRSATRHTIGGGHLEWRATEIARQVLRDGTGPARRLERLPLGASLGQCCGGAVTLAFERLSIADLGWVTSIAKRLAAGQASVRSVSFNAPDAVMISDAPSGTRLSDCLLWGVGSDGVAPGLVPGLGPAGSGTTAETGGHPLLTETIAPDDLPVMLFGAGHVGAALVRVLATLPCRVTWIDERDAFARLRVAELAPTITADAARAVEDAAPGSYFLVMTHSHALDQQLAEAILRRADYAFFGLIGSHTKRRQFEQRLAARGIDPLQIARMHCPIGVAGVTDKAPNIVAVSVAAQLLQVHEQRAAASARQNINA